MNRKKTALLVTVLLTSLLAAWSIFAASAAASSMAMVLPCQKAGWDFGVRALYLRPSYTSGTYLSSYQNASGSESYQSFQPNWSWGYALEGAYHFNQGAQVRVAWWHNSRTTSHDNTIGTAQRPMVVTLAVKPQWDSVYAEFSQLVALSVKSQAAWHAGLAFGRVSTNYYSNLNTLNTPTDEIRLKYNGLGPRVGIDWMRHWDNGVAVYAKSASSLLIGDNRFSTVTTGLLDPNNGITSGTWRALVPAVEAQLGAQMVKSFSEGSLTLDVGYFWMNYFRVQAFRTISGVARNSDFGLNGPFIGLKWLGFI